MYVWQLRRKAIAELNRFTEGGLLRAWAIARASGLPLWLRVTPDVPAADPSARTLCLELAALLEDGQTVAFARYHARFNYSVMPVLLRICLTDLCANARRRAERVHRGLDQLDREEDPEPLATKCFAG